MRRPWHPRAGIPPEYPRELERRVVLGDGAVVHVRPIVPADARALKQAIEGADEETIRRRFLGGRRPTDAASLRHLTTVDYVCRLALVALDDRGEGVALARYEGAPGEAEAEVAVAVAAPWRRRGVATALLRLLAEAALARGIHAFRVSYYASNVDARDLAQLSQHAADPAHPLAHHGMVTVIDEVVPLDELPALRVPEAVFAGDA